MGFELPDLIQDMIPQKTTASGWVTPEVDFELIIKKTFGQLVG
jgi:hypothetical protein